MKTSNLQGMALTSLEIPNEVTIEVPLRVSLYLSNFLNLFKDRFRQTQIQSCYNKNIEKCWLEVVQKVY